MNPQIALFPGINGYHLKILKLMIHCVQTQDDLPTCFIVECYSEGKFISIRYNPDFYDEVYLRDGVIRECDSQKLVGKFNKYVSEDVFEFLHETAMSYLTLPALDLSEFDFDISCLNKINSYRKEKYGCRSKTPAVIKRVITFDGYVDIVSIKYADDIECLTITSENNTYYISSHSKIHSEILCKKGVDIIKEEDLVCTTKSARK